MNRKIVRFSIGAALVCGLVSAQASVDEDFMRYVEDVYKSADNNVAMKDAAAATKDAKELVELFGEIEAHYVKEADEQDGLKLSRQSVELSSTLLKVLLANDFDSASSVSRDIARTCKSCHNIYK
ncbi:MAG: hypothetical protein M0P63_17875 [Azoarcus sp.]|nr:hypothetical protein [Azoarcus sp.]